MSVQLPKLTYSKEEAAQILGITVGSIKWYVRCRKLPCRKISGKLYFTMNDIQSLIDACVANPRCDTKKRKDGNL